MTQYEILDLIASQRNMTAQAWTMFITVNIAVLGGMFFLQKRVNVIEKLIAIVVYGAFLFVNYRAQVDNYTYTSNLISAALELEAQGGTPPIANSIYEMPLIATALPFIYGGAFVAFMITFAFLNFIAGSKE